MAVILKGLLCLVAEELLMFALVEDARHGDKRDKGVHRNMSLKLHVGK